MANKLKPSSMSLEQYEKELAMFNGNEIDRNNKKLSDLRAFFIQQEDN